MIVLNLVDRDTIPFINLILLVSYGVFFVAESFCMGVSGLLALVACGLILNYTVKDMMSQE